MANIQTYLNKIKNAIYGRDVRDSIHDAIDAINTESENTKEIVEDFVGGELDTTLTSTTLPAQGKAVGDAVDGLQSHLNYVKNAPYYTNCIDLSNVGYYLRTDGATVPEKLATQSGLTYSIVMAKQGDAFTIRGVGAQSGQLWAFVDENMNVLQRSGANVNAYTTPTEIKAPIDTVYLITNTYLTDEYKESYVIRIDQEKYAPTEKLDNILSPDKKVLNVSAGTFDYENGNLRIYVDNTTAIKPSGWVLAYCGELTAQDYTIFSAVIDGEDVSQRTKIQFSLRAIDGSHEYSVALGNARTISIPEANSYTLNIFRVEENTSFDGNVFISLAEGSKVSQNTPVSAVDSAARSMILAKNSDVTYDVNALDLFLYSTGKLYKASGCVGMSIDDVQSNNSSGAKSFLIDVEQFKTIRYAVFNSSSYYGSLFLDENMVVIGEYVSTKSGYRTAGIPEGAKYMLVCVSSGWISLFGNTYRVDLSIFDISTSTDNIATVSTPFESVNKNMCLAGIKTAIVDNKIPYNEGYLFHKLQNNDGSLWYGTDFKSINKIGDVGFNPTLMRFAISPKDGRIIAVQRDARNGIWVWNGTGTTHITGLTPEPQAWLYNSGVDFINDGNDEYCVFAEYYGTVVEGYELCVWRGKHPYTSIDNWEKVFTQAQRTNITHFHMIRRDPWTNILYLTAGDGSSESKWWYSTDCGATWTLLVSGTDTGWGNSLCRTINFVFTEDYVYWATDHGESSGEHHTLNRIQRTQSTGVLDLTTKEQLTLLPKLYATNSLCYVESPNGLFMYDRIDTESSSVFGEPIKMLFWDFATEQLVEIASLKLTTNTWGGSRGKCYINYTNSKQPMPAMGFSIDTPCIFDLVCDNPAKIGTIAYDIGSKTVRTIDY